MTASECTCTPPSRSSSFHTASEGEASSPWWELDPSDQEHDSTKDHESKDTKVELPVFHIYLLMIYYIRTSLILCGT